MKKIKLIFALCIVISILLLSACSQPKLQESVGKGSDVPQTTASGDSQNQISPASNDNSTNTQSTIVNETTSTTTTSTTTQISQTPEVKEFKITAKNWAFTPSTIEVNKGDKVRLIVTSADVPHGITIPDYGINQRLDVGVPATIEFTADKSGSFNAFCSVFCGSGHSKMKGQLIVH